MREMDSLHHLQTVARSDGDRSCRPFADAVHSQNIGLLEGRRIKGAGGVALVVFGEQKVVFPIETRAVLFRLLAQQVFLEKLLTKPYRHGHAEG